MKTITVKTSWDCPYNNDFSCQQFFVSECNEKDGVFPAKCRLKNAPTTSTELGMPFNIGSPKLPPCGSCGARAYCQTNTQPDTANCYQAWQQLRVGA